MTNTPADLERLDASLEPVMCECHCGPCHGSRPATTVVVIHDCAQTPPRRVWLMCEPCERDFVRRSAWQIHAAATHGEMFACRGCGVHFHSIADYVLEVSPL